MNKLMSFYIVFIMIVACFAGISLLTSPSVKATLSMSDVLGYWNFDDVVQGTKCQNMKSNDNLTFSGGMSWNNSGKVGHCVYADGANGKMLSNVSYEANYDFDYTHPFSIEFWYNGHAQYGLIVGKGGFESCSGWQIMLYGAHQFLFYGGGWASACASNATFPTDVWVHVVLTYNGCGNNSGMRWYYDGADAGHSNGYLGSSGGVFSSWVTNFPLTCFLQFCDTTYAAGDVDELVIYNKALTPTEVSSRYNGGAGQDYTFSGGAPPSYSPVISNPSPANGSIGVPTNTKFSVDVTHPQGHAMNISMNCYNIGSEALTVDQQYSSSYTKVYGSSWKAQSFTLNNDCLVTKVSLWATRTATGATSCVLSIRDVDGSGKPTGGDLASITVNIQGWGSSPAWHDFTFSSPLSLTAGKYCYVVRVASGDINHCLWYYYWNGNNYAGGNWTYSGDSGSTWSYSFPSVDATFRVYTESSSVQLQTWTGVYNGTRTMNLTGLAVNSLYYVLVNASGSPYITALYHFTTGYVPVFKTSTMYPSPDEIDIPSALTASMYIYQPNGKLFNYTMVCKNSIGTVKGSASGNNVHNGTKTLALSGLLDNSVYYMYLTANVNSTEMQYMNYTFNTSYNYPPACGTPNPVNSSSGEPLSVSWSIYVYDWDSYAHASPYFWVNLNCSNGQVAYPGGLNVTIGGGYIGLALVGLVPSTTYTVWLNMTDSGHPVIAVNYWFTFTTAGVNAPTINYTLSPVSPVNISRYPLTTSYVNFTCAIADPSGYSMNWSIDCNNGQNSSGISYNGTIYLNITSGVTVSKTFNLWINVSNGMNASNGTYVISTRGNVPQVIGTPSLANNTVDVPIALFTYTIPFTDTDIYHDWVRGNISCSNGQVSSAWKRAPNNFTISLIGLTFLTVYKIWMNTTDQWGVHVNKWFTFTTTSTFTHQYFIFSDDAGNPIAFHDIVYSDFYINGTSLALYSYYETTDPNYGQSGALCINTSISSHYIPLGAFFTVDIYAPIVVGTTQYVPFSGSFQYSVGAIHPIGLMRLLPSYTFSNKREWVAKDLSTWEYIDIWTNKVNYNLGDQIVIYYRLPSLDWFSGTGKSVSAYYLMVHTWNNRPGMWGNPVANAAWKAPDGSPAYTLSYQQSAALAFTNWRYIYLIANDATFGALHQGENKFSVDFGRSGGLWFGINDIITLGDGSMSFTINSGSVIPNGTLYDPVPLHPSMLETTYFKYRANNNGQMEVYDLLDPVTDLSDSTTSKFIQPFNTPNNSTTNNTFSYAFPYTSTFEVVLKVSNGPSMKSVLGGTKIVVTNGTNNSGGNIEYLQCDKERYLTGDWVSLYYNNKATTGQIDVTLPNGETSMYGINLSIMKGVYRFKLQPHSQIGEYTVTMHGKATLTASFNVVADDYNYVEFMSNTYDSDASFAIYIVNNVNVVVIFLKENVNHVYIPQGERLYFDAGKGPGQFSVPRTYVVPSVGNWRVELWSTNARIPIQKLASYDATVTITLPSNHGILNNGAILPIIGGAIGLIVGLIIMVFIILSPFIVSRLLGFTNNPPMLVYGFMGAIGLVVTIGLGFFPFWVAPFMVIVGVIIVMIGWLYGRKDGGQGL